MTSPRASSPQHQPQATPVSPAPSAGVRPVGPRPTGLGSRLLAGPVVAYRRWLSPALPARCRFYPSCSAYALTALARHGVWRGAGLAIWRLLRCHPFHPGGYDPVPETHATGAD